MNDEGRSPAAPVEVAMATERLAPAPALVLVLELEGKPKARLLGRCPHEKRQLALWLRRSEFVRDFQRQLEEALDKWEDRQVA